MVASTCRHWAKFVDVQKPLSAYPLSGSTRTPGIALVLTPPQQWTLTPGHTYEAKLLGLAKDLLNAPPPQTNTAPADAPTMNAGTTPQPKPQNDWILRLQGQHLLVSLPSEAVEPPPQPGMRLWLRVNQDGTLSFQPAKAVAAPVATNSSLLDPQVTTDDLQWLQQRLQSNLAPLLTRQLGLPALSVLLDSLTKPTAPQVSAGATAAMPAPSLSPQATALRQLLQALPRQHQLLDVQHQAPTQQASGMATQIKHWLSAQGLNFEHKLVQNLAKDAANTPGTQGAANPPAPASLETLKQQVREVLQNLQAPGAANQHGKASAFESPKPGTPQLLQNTVTQATLSATPLHDSFYQSASARLLLQLQQMGAQLPAGSSQNAHTTPTETLSTGTNPVAPGSTAAQLPDLKAVLLGLVRDLAPHVPREQASSSLPPALDTLLLQQPLAFPRLQPDLATLKASAMLADQELTTGQMLRLLAGLLHRIQFNQLNSLLQSSSNSTEGLVTQTWLLDLPILNQAQQLDLFQLRLDREQTRQQEEAEKRSERSASIQWKISLAFDFADLGPITIQVRVRPPAATSLIWAGRDSTLKLLQQHSEHFAERLQALGLEVAPIQYQQGAPKSEQKPLQANIVDTRA